MLRIVLRIALPVAWLVRPCAPLALRSAAPVGLRSRSGSSQSRRRAAVLPAASSGFWGARSAASRRRAADEDSDVEAFEGSAEDEAYEGSVEEFTDSEHAYEGTAPDEISAATGLHVGVGSESVVFAGDYVVHFERGVCQYAGRFDGETEGASSAERPILLRFQERCVALDFSEAKRLTRLQGGAQYDGESMMGSGANDELAVDFKPPRLSKWAKPESWHALREKAIQASREHAHELLTMAAARSERSRATCEPLSAGDVAELDRGFGVGRELTGGQRGCLDDIEEDMCRRTKPMDRLVMGDVGYGKTELALRAVAMAVRSGRQVAVLAPTTTLATQHYRIFKMRLSASLNCSVELLRSAGSGKSVGEDSGSTLTATETRAESKRVRAAIASGACQVAVGTHALLSPRQSWKHLGLAIIDEEQRFGVAQKERLKEVTCDVDVLTLSATPIPRTLSAALAGLRDVSELLEPPPGRGKVVSIVCSDEHGRPSDDRRLAALLDRELKRGGQAFYVVPRVADIPRAKRRLHAALRCLGHPNAEDESTVRVAHGRVSNGASVIEAFSQGNNLTAPVLLATTIVENGLDLPGVNTIVVQDAHVFGLASLHQLRGRVGRGERRAVAAFLHPRGGLERLTATASARLRAVGDSRRQSGPELARRDLEIRGGGALLGTRQSGRHSRSIGDEMYAQLVCAEIDRLRALDVRAAPEGCDARELPAAELLRVRLEGDAPVDELVLESCKAIAEAPTVADVLQLTRKARDDGALQRPEVKLAVKLRYLELHAARLGFEKVTLQIIDEPSAAPSVPAFAPNGVAAAREPPVHAVDLLEELPASALLHSSHLDPKTWALLRREVPENLRASLRFDEPNARVEVVRLGALAPLKQLEFLLEVALHMTRFLDRVAQVRFDDFADAKKSVTELPPKQDASKDDASNDDHAQHAPTQQEHAELLAR